MTDAKKVTLPLSRQDMEELKAGDVVALNGTVFTARDAAHKRLCALIEKGEQLPFPLDGACIYYAGPCPAAPNEVIGPCGPTTSGRCDGFTPHLIENGMTGMIGKGQRDDAVKTAMLGRAVYFAATGGAAALIARCITAAEVVAFPELGAEAVRKLTVKDLPAIVAIDAHGGDLYKR